MLVQSLEQQQSPFKNLSGLIGRSLPLLLKINSLRHPLGKIGPTKPALNLPPTIPRSPGEHMLSAGKKKENDQTHTGDNIEKKKTGVRKTGGRSKKEDKIKESDQTHTEVSEANNKSTDQDAANVTQGPPNDPNIANNQSNEDSSIEASGVEQETSTGQIPVEVTTEKVYLKLEDRDQDPTSLQHTSLDEETQKQDTSPKNGERYNYAKPIKSPLSKVIGKLRAIYILLTNIAFSASIPVVCLTIPSLLLRVLNVTPDSSIFLPPQNLLTNTLIGTSTLISLSLGAIISLLVIKKPRLIMVEAAFEEPEREEKARLLPKKPSGVLTILGWMVDDLTRTAGKFLLIGFGFFHLQSRQINFHPSELKRSFQQILEFVNNGDLKNLIAPLNSEALSHPSISDIIRTVTTTPMLLIPFTLSLALLMRNFWGYINEFRKK